MIGAVALGVAVVGGAAHGAFHRNSPIFGRVRTHTRARGTVVALTFDDGPNPDATPAIAGWLDRMAGRPAVQALPGYAPQR